MSERYSKLFSLPEKLYVEGAPVLIAAGALLKDNQTGNIVAQLKLKNIGKKTIKTAKVKLSPFDSMNRPLGREVVYDYLDLNNGRDTDFGAKNAICFQDSATRAFSAQVIEVGFQDNSIWSSADQTWMPLATQDLLEKVYPDKELAKQFKEEYGKQAVFEPKQDRDLWQCFCGAVNHKEETKCHICGNNPYFDLSSLKEKCELRLEREKAEAERRAAEEAAVQAAKKATGTKIKKALIIVASLIIIVIALALINKRIIQPSNKYRQAISLRDSGRYDEAIELFAELGDFKDASAQISETRYIYGMDSLNSNHYDEALSVFRSLGEYRDSPQQILNIQETKYNEGLDAIKKQDYQAAARCFSFVRDYLDSNDYIYYTAVKCIDFDDGKAHDMYSVFEKIKMIKNADFRFELESIPQVQQARALNGSYYRKTGDHIDYAYSRDIEDGKITGVDFSRTVFRDMIYKDGRLFEFYYSENEYAELRNITSRGFSIYSRYTLSNTVKDYNEKYVNKNNIK